MAERYSVRKIAYDPSLPRAEIASGRIYGKDAEDFFLAMHGAMVEVAEKARLRGIAQYHSLDGRPGTLK